MAGFGTTEEEPVLFADGRGANGVLYEVVVDLYPGVFGVDKQLVPEFEGVADGFWAGVRLVRIGVGAGRL